MGFRYPLDHEGSLTMILSMGAFWYWFGVPTFTHFWGVLPP